VQFFVHGFVLDPYYVLGTYLSGVNFSGSCQMLGSWWMYSIGISTTTPLGIVTPLITLVSLAVLVILVVEKI